MSDHRTKQESQRDQEKLADEVAIEDLEVAGEDAEDVRGGTYVTFSMTNAAISSHTPTNQAGSSPVES
jgi:hypothetical protein